MKRQLRTASVAVLAGGLVAALSAGTSAAAAGVSPQQRRAAAAGGRGAGLPTAPKHVVVIAMDNTHLSDVEQMPSVAHFLAGGTLFTNDHTGLIAYTHADYDTIASGRYPDQTGIVSQFQYDRNPDGTLAPVSFSYWYDRTAAGLPTHLGPAPWTYWTSHGDAVAAVGWGDMELESTSELGQYGVKVATGLTATDYFGYALHEPDGSTVFGTPNLPAVQNAPLLLDPTQTVGMFDNSAGYDANFGPDRSLTATAALLEQGVPVVYTYIRSAHNSPTGASLQPGTPAYLQNLAHYDASFAAFFAQLAAHGITPANTDFVLTSDEGDHYNPGGELSTGLAGQFSQVGFPFTPGPDEQLVANSASMLYWPSSASEPLATLTNVPGWRYLADTQVLQAIHAAPGNPAYDPNLVIFAEPSWYYGSGTSTAITTAPYYWNHGTVARDINAMWMGLAGPGVPSQVSTEWIDNADVLPTLLQLSFGQQAAGLQGVAAVDAFEPQSPFSLKAFDPARAGRAELLRGLVALYQQLNAPLGHFSRQVLQIGTTAAIEPQLGTTLESGLGSLVPVRDAVASRLQSLIVGLESGQGAGRFDLGGAIAAVASARQVLAQLNELDSLALQR